MVAAAIVTAEVGFWLLLLGGLWSRYRLRRRRLGAVLLALTPVVDLALLAVVAVDLGNGATADCSHALAAIYVGVSVAFGPRLIAWADARFAGAERAPQPRTGAAHARREHSGWYRHALAWAIGSGLLLGAVALVGDADRTAALLNTAGAWTLVLAIDFLWSFSYTLWPRAARS